MKKRDYIYMSALLSIILAVIFISTPQGYKFATINDFTIQHTPFPEYFRILFYETGNIFPDYAPNLGTGVNIYYLSYYGLLNPIILFSYLLPFVEMFDYIVISSIVMYSISVLLFYKWIKVKYGSEIAFVSSIMFLSAAPLLFHSYHQIMFVNYMSFLILALIGVDKYKSDNKSWLLILSIFLIIMTSYYYSITCILVIFLYYIYNYIDQKVNFKLLLNKTFKFLLFTLISVFMSAVLILPTAYVIITGRTNSLEKLDMYTLLVPNINLKPLLYSNYAIGLTAICLIALLVSFQGNEKRKKIISTIILVCIFFPIVVYVLNGTRYARAKILIPFIPLIVFYVSDYLYLLINNKTKIFDNIILAVFTTIVLKQMGYEYLYFYIDILIVIISLILYAKFKNKYIVYIPIILASLTILVSTNSNSEHISNTTYNKVFDNEFTDNIIEDEGYYRTNNIMSVYQESNKIVNQTLKPYTALIVSPNKIENINQYQTSIYSSTYPSIYENFNNNIVKNNIPARNKLIITNTPDIIFNTFMGVKYIINDEDFSAMYKEIDDNLYVNENVRPIIYSTNHLINDAKFDEISYPYNTDVLLNNIVVNGESNDVITSKVQKVDNVFQITSSPTLQVENSNGILKINALEDTKFRVDLTSTLSDKILYIQFTNLIDESCKNGDTFITINNISNRLTCSSWQYHNNNYEFEYKISNANLDHLDVEIGKGDYEIANIETYTLDYKDLIRNNVDEFAIDKNETSGNKIVGDINVTNDGYIATTIVYDKGYSIKVNGEIVEYEKVNKAFLGVKTTKGAKHIEITYNAPYKQAGLIISLIGIVIFIVICLREGARKNEKN